MKGAGHLPLCVPSPTPSPLPFPSPLHRSPSMPICPPTACANLIRAHARVLGQFGLKASSKESLHQVARPTWPNIECYRPPFVVCVSPLASRGVHRRFERGEEGYLSVVPSRQIRVGSVKGFLCGKQISLERKSVAIAVW